MNTNKILGMATMLVLGTAMQASLAQSISSPYKIALETADVGSTGVFVIPGSTGIDVSVIPNRMISSTAPYFVVFTLTGGAQFSGSGVNLLCGYSATLAIGSAAGNTAAVDSPAAAAGGSVAAFKVQSAGANGAVTSCYLQFSGGSGIVMTSGNKDYGVSISNRHTDPSDTVTSTVAGTIITFVQGLQASVSAGSVTIDVVSPALSKKFLVAGSVVSGVTAFGAGSTTAVAALGVIKYTPSTDVYISGGTLVERASYLSQATITVSGALIAGAVSATSGSSTVTGYVFLSSTANCSAGPVSGGNSAIDLTHLQSTGAVASGNQVSFTVSANDFNTGVSSGIHVCMMPNGITTLEKGVVSFSVSVTSALSNSKPNLTISDTVLTKVVKNGTSVKVLNLPPPDYTTDVAYVRFYNMGSVTGKVYGTLYSQGTTDGNNTGGGSVLGTSNFTLIESLAPGQVVTLSGPAIGSKVGLTTWPGRAWMQVESEVRGLRIQALIRSGGPQGTLTNMSDRIMADGETLQRTD